jgi:non-heme chloroperoxidase
MHYWTGHAGIRIAGDSWGPPNGPLVLLQHGGGQTRHAWRGAGKTLGEAGYHAVAFDARGHGDTDWAPDGNYSQDIMVRDLKCVITDLGNQRPVLVGASLGGGTSLVAVGERHVDATALVLVDVAPNIEVQGVENIHVFMSQNPEGFDSLEEVSKAIASYQPHRVRPRNLDGLGKNVRRGRNGKSYWHWDPQFRAAEFDLELRTKRLEACTVNLDLPTLLVRGGLTDLLSEAGAQAFLKLCPRAEYACISSAGHMVAGDRNDIFATAVIEFLSRVVPISGELSRSPRPSLPVQESLVRI